VAEGKGKRRRSLHEAFGQEAPRPDLNVRQCPTRGMWVPSCFLSDFMHPSARLCTYLLATYLVCTT
jgi:hypothetical protein